MFKNLSKLAINSQLAILANGDFPDWPTQWIRKVPIRPSSSILNKLIMKILMAQMTWPPAWVVHASLKEVLATNMPRKLRGLTNSQIRRKIQQLYASLWAGSTPNKCAGKTIKTLSYYIINTVMQGQVTELVKLKTVDVNALWLAEIPGFTIVLLTLF